MRFFGIIGMLISLAIVGYLMMKQMKPSTVDQAAKMKNLQKEHGIELPAEVLNGGDLTKLPATLKKDLERQMKQRTPDLRDK